MEGAKLRLPLILVSLTTLSHGRHIDSKEALYTHTHQAYLQRGFTQDVRCLTRLGNNERVRSVTWLELGGLYPVQIARYVIPGLGTNYTRDHHYGLTETYSLVIGEARINDSGFYGCRVTLRTGQALDPYEITITVVDTTFPENLDPQNITGFNLQRGQEHEFQCPLSSSDRSRNTTVYWCEDVDGETRIMDVKFSDGEVLVNKNYLGDTTFPGNLDPQNITGFNLQRGQKQEFQCPLSSSDRSRNTTVYWCEDVDGETRIMGVKFSDGKVLVLVQQILPKALDQQYR
ncbi:uncharacterized protein LOC110975047 [Acanthaster planci]|uniref:Uncharacterized protein LOC110975047 n=1 Tax=Acanthaster planci TaxID=133434 RepID=A0A8B7XPT7_ACAPL|nr:uncharacterized protein LOC110975047 [Acanthaster planci]